MKRIIPFLFLLFSIPALAQNFSTVTANQIEDASGSGGLLQSGSICFQPVDASNRATNFMAGGGGVVHSEQVCRAVINGVMQGPLNLAASDHTSPVGIQYRVTVTDDIQNTTMGLGTVYITGSIFDVDNWAPTNVTTLPYAGPSFISGALTAAGDITALHFHGIADSAIAAVTSQKWAVLPQQCPSGYSSSHFDISGNALDCNADSFQPSGTTTGVIAQSPAGNQMITLASGAHQRIGNASSYADFDVNGDLTIPEVISSGALGGMIDIRSKGAVTTPGVDNASAINAAITAAATTGQTVLVPTGTFEVHSTLTLPANVKLTGLGQQSILNFVSSSALTAGVLINNANNVQITNMTLQCASSPATCVSVVSINNSTGDILTDTTLSGGGYASIAGLAGTNLTIQSSFDLDIERNTFINDGAVTGYVIGLDFNVGNPYVESARLFFKDNRIYGHTASYAFVGYELESAQIIGNYINQGNIFDNPTCNDACGYGFMAYERGMNAMATSGATMDGTNTITVTFPTAQLPTTPYGQYDLTIAGVTTCSGTQPNGNFHATAISPTQATFTSTGTTCVAAAFNAGATITPKVLPGNDTFSSNIVYNAAGSCYYLQTTHNTTLTGNVARQCAQQMTPGSLAVGGIAVGGGDHITFSGNQVVCSSQYGEDIETADQVTVKGDVIDQRCSAAANTAGVHLNVVTNSQISVSTDGSKQGILAVNGTVGNDITGIFHSPTLTGITLNDSAVTDNTVSGTVNAAIGATACLLNLGLRNSANKLRCNGAPIQEQGSKSEYHSVRVYNVPGLTAFKAVSTTSLLVDNLQVDTAASAFVFTGTNSDVTIKNSKFWNLSGVGVQDAANTTMSGTFTSGSPTVTVTNCNGLNPNVILADFAASNWIPIGTRVSTCSVTTLTMTANATGSGSETFNVYANYTIGFNWINNEVFGLFPTQQPCFLSYAIQDLNWRGGSCKGFYSIGTGGAIVDIRGVSNTIGGAQAIQNLLVVGGTGGLDSGIKLRDLATGFQVQNNVVNNPSRYSTEDVSTGANVFTNNHSSMPTHITNTNASISNTPLTALATLSYTAIAAQSSQEQTMTVPGAVTAAYSAYCSPRSSLAAGLSWQSWVSAANTVSVRIVNGTAASSTPGNITFGCSVSQ